jgi:acetyl esterase
MVMILDPQVAALLDMFRTQGMPDFVDLGVEGARQAVAAFLQLEGPPAEVAEVRELTAPGPDGNVLPMRSYRPALDGDLPVLLYFHGGGFVIGDLAVADAPCRELANATGAIVISVDYRMGPEHRSPAAAEDCYAATVWAERHASSLGGDGARLGVSGDSAGGNLATVVALMARDRGGPALRAQFLLCPITDLDLTTDAYPSRVENGEGYLLTARTLAWFYENYLEKPDDAADIHNSPIHADLSALPPAVVVTAGYDPLRDEGDAYAAALRAAGVEVLHLPNPSMIHGFLWMAGVVDHAHAVFDQVGAFAKKHL